MSDGAIIACFIAAVAALIAAIVVACFTVGYYVDKSRCHSFGAQTGRETKFVKYNLTTWDCLARTRDGKWLPKNQLREMTP